MNWSKWIRQTHRWLSMAFTLAVIVNIVAIAQKKYTNSVGLLAVIPLALQFFTGLLVRAAVCRQMAQQAIEPLKGSQLAGFGYEELQKADAGCPIYQLSQDPWAVNSRQRQHPAPRAMALQRC